MTIGRYDHITRREIPPEIQLGDRNELIPPPVARIALQNQAGSSSSSSSSLEGRAHQIWVDGPFLLEPSWLDLPAEESLAQNKKLDLQDQLKAYHSCKTFSFSEYDLASIPTVLYRLNPEVAFFHPKTLNLFLHSIPGNSPMLTSLTKLTLKQTFFQDRHYDVQGLEKLKNLQTLRLSFCNASLEIDFAKMPALQNVIFDDLSYSNIVTEKLRTQLAEQKIVHTSYSQFTVFSVSRPRTYFQLAHRVIDLDRFNQLVILPARFSDIKNAAE